ncbi:MAG: GWxTD domain-containing protein [Candidatus Cloacimonadales bacterium]
MRLSVVIILLFITQQLWSANLTTERVGETSLLALTISTTELYSKNDEFSYRVIFEVLDSKDKIVYLTKKDILFSKQAVDKNSQIILLLETDLGPASYTGYLKVNSTLRNDKSEEKFDFVIAENKPFSNLYLFRKVNDVNIEVISWDEIKKYSDVYLYQLYEESVTDLSFISENETERKITSITPTDKLYKLIDNSYFTLEHKKSYVEFNLQNNFYQAELKILAYMNSFQKKYSWEDQLEQIRYIVNDRAWKEINSGKLNDSEKVLRFWQSQNPKNTPNNELQDIFYNRILQTEQKFSVHKYKDGWKTDRGRIYIKFGAPDEISVDNLPLGRYPAQKWQYYHLNKTFYFYDRTGIEDYKLYNKEEEYGF